LALEVVGSRATAALEGEDVVAAVLSPGSLRSGLFGLQPLYRGKYLRRLVVWGAGTGDGRGLCVAGALGQATLGRGWREILRSYFPGTEIEGLHAAAIKPPVRVKTPAPREAAPAKGIDLKARRALRERLRRQARERR
jgi:peptidoglycan hydrolase-like amidase